MMNLSFRPCISSSGNASVFWLCLKGNDHCGDKSLARRAWRIDRHLHKDKTNSCRLYGADMHEPMFGDTKHRCNLSSILFSHQCGATCSKILLQDAASPVRCRVTHAKVTALVLFDCSYNQASTDTVTHMHFLMHMHLPHTVALAAVPLEGNGGANGEVMQTSDCTSSAS